MLIHGKFMVDCDSCTITYDQKVLSLTHQEYLLLLLFLKFPNQVLTYGRIIEYLHDNSNKDEFVIESTVRSHIKLLRQSLRDVSLDENIIETVRGLGYRLKPLSHSDKVKNVLLTPSLSVLREFIKSQKIEYLVFDEDLTIQSISPAVKIYCDYPDELKIGKYLGYAFPELIGYEEILEKVVNRQEPVLSLKGIERVNNNNQISYINIYVIADSSESAKSLEKQRLFAFFENYSDEMLLRQQLVHYANQAALNEGLSSSDAVKYS